MPHRGRAITVSAPQKLPRVLTVAETQAILDACEHLRGRFLLAILWDAGLRIGEALGLRHEDIAAAERSVTVVRRVNGNRARSKSRQQRTVPVSAQVIRLYGDYLHREYGDLDSDYVFVNLWAGPAAPGSELATRVAANSRPYAEKYAHLAGLPYGRVDIRTTEYPGQLVIEVREKDPSVSGPVTHPALDLDSPYTDWFPEPASIRDPVPIGVIPETSEPMELVLWDEEGGKAIGIYSMTGGGKTNLLDELRERITAMDDAVLVQLNAAGSGDELSWEPLAAMTAAGLQADDPGLRQRIIGALQWARHLIGERSETAVHTGESVFQPTRQDPAVVVMIDEIDETCNIEGASKLLEFLASKQRQQVTPGAAPRVDGGRLQQRADLVQRPPHRPVVTAINRHRPGRRRVQPEDQPHGRRLAELWIMTLLSGK
jgi:hypothetical protein